MKVAGKTDIGCIRSENQDDYRAGRLANGDAWGLVCDGMGGAQAGRLAATMSTDWFESSMRSAIKNGLYQNPEQLLEETFQGMNLDVYEHSRSHPDCSGMGTTAVCAFVQNGTAHIAHVGDSRAYLFRGQQVEQLTKDHSMVQQLLESGQITAAEAEKHPHKNLITRAIGVSRGVQVDHTVCPLAEGDVLLLCSDGLSNMVSEEQIKNIIANTSFFDVPERLVQLALRAGGQDNITVLVMGTEPGEV